MDKPKSRTAIEIMQRADPSCKIWFVCKGQLICTRDKDVRIARADSPLIPDLDRHTLQLSPHQEEEYAQEEGDFVLELGLHAEIEEACMAAESLMRRALDESSRRRKANEEELASALQKAKEYKELYLEEARKREELEAALARANREIARLKKETNNQSTGDRQDSTAATAEPDLQEEMAEASSVERRHGVDDMNDTGVGLLLGTSGQAVIEPQAEGYMQLKIGSRGGNGASELQALLLLHRSTTSSKQAGAAFSPSSVIQSPYDDEDCAPSYFLCPILQEASRSRTASSPRTPRSVARSKTT